MPRYLKHHIDIRDNSNNIRALQGAENAGSLIFGGSAIRGITWSGFIPARRVSCGSSPPFPISYLSPIIRKALRRFATGRERGGNLHETVYGVRTCGGVEKSVGGAAPAPNPSQNAERRELYEKDALTIFIPPIIVPPQSVPIGALRWKKGTRRAYFFTPCPRRETSSPPSQNAEIK